MTHRHVSAPAVNDSVACAVKLVVVDDVFQPQKLLDLSRDHLRQHEAILNTGPGEDSLFEMINGFAYKDATKEQRDKALISYSDLMTQRHVSAPAVLDSVACAVRLVVWEAFTAHGTVCGPYSVAAVAKYVVEQEFGTENYFTAKSEQREHILNSGPGLPKLYREINGIAALPVAA